MIKAVKAVAGSSKKILQFAIISNVVNRSVAASAN